MNFCLANSFINATYAKILQIVYLKVLEYILVSTDTGYNTS